MIKPMFAALALGVVAVPALGAIDFNLTERGSHRLTGGRPDLTSYGLSALLMEFNNDLDPKAGLPRFPSVDLSRGLEGDNLNFAIGYLSIGRDGTIFTYDRLAYRPVLQILGFDTFRLDNDPPRYIPPPPLSLPMIRGGGPVRNGNGGESITPFVIPEPASLALLSLGMALICRRPRKDRPNGLTA